MNVLPPYSSKTWKIIGALFAGLFVLGIVLFTLDSCTGYFSNRKVDQHKANINAILSNIQAIESGKIAATKEELAAEKKAAEIETEALINASGATNEAKAETNKALANLDAAKNANTANSSAADLERALEKLND